MSHHEDTATIAELRDEALLRLAALAAAAANPQLWARIDKLGLGLAERAATLLADAQDATISEAEMVARVAVTPLSLACTACGHVFPGTVGQSRCPACTGAAS